MNALRLYLLGDGVQASRPLLWLIGFFAFLNVYSMQSVLPMLMHEFSASPVQAGMTVGATALGVAIISPFMGMLSDAVGRKVILCASMFIMTLPSALIALAGNLEQIIVLRFMQGLAVPGIAVTLIAYIAEEFRADNVARMTALYVGGTVMGGFCGRFITGHTAELFGWRAAFICLAALSLGGALLTLWLLPGSRAFTPSRDVKGALQTFGRHLRNQRLLASCAVGFCVLFSLVGTFTYINLHLAAPPFSLSAAGLANVFVVYLGGVLLTPIAGRHVGKLGFQRSLLLALVFSAAGLFLTLTSSLPLIILGLVICSSGIFICQSVTISFIGAHVSEGRSLATGLYYMSYYAGGAFGSWLPGLAFEHWGWSGSVLVIAALQLAAALIAFSAWSPPNARTPLADS